MVKGTKEKLRELAGSLEWMKVRQEGGRKRGQQTHHPVPQWAVVVPQKPPALQHWLSKWPPLHVKSPLLAPQLPSTDGMSVALHWLAATLVPSPLSLRRG